MATRFADDFLLVCSSLYNRRNRRAFEIDVWDAQKAIKKVGAKRAATNNGSTPSPKKSKVLHSAGQAGTSRGGNQDNKKQSGSKGSKGKRESPPVWHNKKRRATSYAHNQEGEPASESAHHHQLHFVHCC